MTTTDNVTTDAIIEERIAPPAGFRAADVPSATGRRHCYGTPYAVGGRQCGASAVIAQDSDGTLHDGRVLVEVGGDERYLTLTEARTFAAAITAAADELGAVAPEHPLDRFTTREILDEIARRACEAGIG